MTGYTTELRSRWRPVLGAFIGMAAGLSTTAFVTALMGKYLVEGLGWEKSQYALVTTLALSGVIAAPLAGRLGDIVGARRTAMIGIVSLPLIYVGYSQMNAFGTYVVLFLLQSFLAVTTTAGIYCRIVVAHVSSGRGLALAIAASGPGIVGIVGTPFLNKFMEANGWRAGYLLMAALFAIGGAVSLWLLPPDRPRADAAAAVAAPSRRNFGRDFAILRRKRAFWIILIGMFLVNLSYLVLPQLSLIVSANGFSIETASLMVSTYAVGMLIGRVLCGLALDRYPAPLVSALFLALTAIGIFVIASGTGSTPVAFGAVLLIGLSYGSESDMTAFLIARNFGISVYSTVFGFVMASMTLGTACGGLLLSLMLRGSGDYGPFLIASGCAVLLGSLLVSLLPRDPVIPDFDADEPPEVLAGPFPVA